eukprot:jgi/Botrbrau1/549/Bobra.0010s0024.1
MRDPVVEVAYLGPVFWYSSEKQWGLNSQESNVCGSSESCWMHRECFLEIGTGKCIINTFALTVLPQIPSCDIDGMQGLSLMDVAKQIAPFDTLFSWTPFDESSSQWIGKCSQRHSPMNKEVQVCSMSQASQILCLTLLLGPLLASGFTEQLRKCCCLLCLMERH